ncbi:glycosyltransferase family 9 protein [Dyella psychrodurans]|uniref:Lipopolysaccharide heptosyltransferase family protein n=1 Tax=Dyella psychrodurans TaxID=1927960 RepID=A0A370XEP5_9GAMM|nr:glycosyltransferase family 9 protein [Dyella psychrodurans]RDS86715.1 lipopolysaccharide heptosyltransferase family protein [Dyella psychrodurans]
MLLITPLVAELERTYKGAEIDIVSEGALAADIFATFFSVKNIYCLPRRGFKHPPSFLSLIFKIRKTHYDLIIDPSFGSGFSRTLTRIFKGRYKLGFSDSATSPELTHAVPQSMAPKHMAKRPVGLVRWHSPVTHNESPGFPAMDIRLTADERSNGKIVIQQLLGASAASPVPCVIGIFADATGSKRYPTTWWNEFIASLQELSPHVAIIEIVPMHGKSMLGSAWPSYYSSSIRRMAAVMSGLDMVISADCGVMHLAAASRVPTLGMFCVTDANVYGPYGDLNSSLVTKELTPDEAARRVLDSAPASLKESMRGTRITHRVATNAQASNESILSDSFDQHP